MTEDETEAAGDNGQDNAMAIDALEDEDEDFVPPNPTSIIISPYDTIIDPTRLYFIAIGRGIKTAAKIKTFIQSSDSQVTTLCSWWNLQSKQWQYIPKGYKPVSLTPPIPTPSMAEDEADGEDHVDQHTMDQDGEKTSLDLTPVPYSVDEAWDPVDPDVDMIVHGSPSSGSNYSDGVRVRDKQRDKLRERNERKGRQVEMNTDEEDIQLDADVFGNGPIDDGCEGEDRTPRASVPDSDQGENSDDENVHRLEVRQGKTRQVNTVDSNATATRQNVGGNSKEMEQGIQDLWIMVTKKCRALGKSPACALKEAGFVILLSCRPNSWNVYRTWLCLQPQCPPGT